MCAGDLLDTTNALSTLFSMNLSSKRPGWSELKPLPGPGRILAAAGGCQGSFYVFGGAALRPGLEGMPARDWLRDAWRYTPGQGWKRLADLPRAAVAAPSPTPVVNGTLLVIGGDDGSRVNAASADHPGFRRDVLAYHPRTDQWEQFGDAPFGQVTTTAVQWKDRIVIASGEVKPGVRSPEVWSAR